MELRQLAKTGESIPAVGMGTWALWGRRGPRQPKDEDAVEAIRYGLDLGMNLIDTAEMYGSGHSEEIVSHALRERSSKVFVASKVSPQHFGYDDVLRSARSSLKRLGVKQMDLYQLHWPNPRIPVSETMRAMEKLVQDGQVRYIGVSNFSIEQMRKAQAALSREDIVSNQVEYNLIERSIEKQLLPYCQRERITVIAYSPLGQGRIPRGRGGPFQVLDEVARSVGKTRCQVALNWLLQHDQVVVIPKAMKREHLKQNSEVTGWKLSGEDFTKLNRAFT